jgi:hypothetical protein
MKPRQRIAWNDMLQISDVLIQFPHAWLSTGWPNKRKRGLKMKFHGKSLIKLQNADIHLHYANNKGRGSDNVTVTVVKSGTPRNKNSNYSEFIHQFRVSGWRGNVNVPTDIIKKLGGVKEAI